MFLDRHMALNSSSLRGRPIPNDILDTSKGALVPCLPWSIMRRISSGLFMGSSMLPYKDYEFGDFYAACCLTTYGLSLSTRCANWKSFRGLASPGFFFPLEANEPTWDVVLAYRDAFELACVWDGSCLSWHRILYCCSMYGLLDKPKLAWR